MRGREWAQKAHPSREATYSKIALDASRLRLRKPPKPTGRKRRLTLVASDVHFPKQDPGAWSIFLQAVRDLEPDGIYLMGDVLDLATASTHHELAITDLGLTLRQEFTAANHGLNQLDDVATKAWDRLWLEGNHEFRLERWKVNNCPPQLRDAIPTVEDALRVRERGYRVIPGGEQPIKVGDLHLLHGHFFGADHCRKHLQTLGVNVAYGHVHTPGQATTNTANGPLQSTCFPCLRTLTREWTHMSKVMTWTNGFGIIEWIDGVRASVRNVYIVDGAAVYGGHVWRASK